MKRRRLVFLTAAFTTSIALVAACTIPDLAFVAGQEGGTPDSPGADVNDAGGDVVVGANEDVDPGGRDAEAGLADVEQLDAASLDAACCDCDEDGFIGIHPDAGCPKVPDAAVDCDDYIKAINPDAGFLLNDTWPSKHKAFDWNCDGVVTKQLEHDLTKDCSCLVVCGCSQPDGFEDDPGCGATTNYFGCSGGALACTYPSLGTRTQGCK